MMTAVIGSKYQKKREKIFFVVCLSLLFAGICSSVADEAEPKEEEKIEDFSFAERTESWIEQSKNPLPWLKWGADLRIRPEYYSNTKQNNDTSDHELNQQRIRFRVWTEMEPFENFSFYIRGNNESRTYIKPDSEQGYFGELLIDGFYLKAEAEEIPLQFKLGRQELSNLKVPWLIQDGTTQDGTRSTFFDSARISYEFSDGDTTLDAVYMYMCARSDSWLPPIGRRPSEKYVAEQDIQGGILLARNRSLEDLTLEGLLIYTHAYESDLNQGWTGDLVTVRPKVVYEWDDCWSWSTEIAGQFGRRGDHQGENMKPVLAYGGLSQLDYSFNDSWNTKLSFALEYLSGNRKDSSVDNRFDVLWGRYSRLGELMSYSTRLDGGRKYDYFNMASPYLAITLQPMEKLTLGANYRALFAPENPYAGDENHSVNGHFKGHLLRVRTDYAFSKHLAAHILFETLQPGDYYSSNADDPIYYIRCELNLSY